MSETCVGRNRSDLQVSIKSRRSYVEWETAGSSRGPGHATRIQSNDSAATGVKLIDADAWANDLSRLFEFTINSAEHIFLITRN